MVLKGIKQDARTHSFPSRMILSFRLIIGTNICIFYNTVLILLADHVSGMQMYYCYAFMCTNEWKKIEG